MGPGPGGQRVLRGGEEVVEGPLPRVREGDGGAGDGRRAATGAGLAADPEQVGVGAVEELCERLDDLGGSAGAVLSAGIRAGAISSGARVDVGRGPAAERESARLVANGD